MSINKINNKIEIEKGPQKLYEIVVKEVTTGKIIYKDISLAGLLCTVEKIIRFDNQFMEGNHQCVNWGHPFFSFYCLERLHEFIEEKKDEIMATVRKVK